MLKLNRLLHRDAVYRSFSLYFLQQQSYSVKNIHPPFLFASSYLYSRPLYTLSELEFPGGRVPLTSQLSFISESSMKRVPCYRVLDDNGNLVSSENSLQVFIDLVNNSSVKVGKETAVKMFTAMVTLQIMDSTFFEAQRQGRISFYATTFGEEAINIASAAALSDSDLVFPQYREPGVLLWRGFTIQEFANQCFGNKADYGKGRQMPIHYGSKKLNYFTVSATIATQLPHAVGAAYSLKMNKSDACVITYVGDGGTSEGDFHSALNFAAVLKAPVIFFCRNNGWAISTPVEEQFNSDGIVVRGRAYGIQSIRVDGNDALAVYNAVSSARRIAVAENKPILIEALTYRVGHHSTSDDSTKYRSTEEMEWWKSTQDPTTRFRKWIEGNGWWNGDEESVFRDDIKRKVVQAIQIAEKMEKPKVGDMFTDVYDVLPSNLVEQEKMVKETVRKNPIGYPRDVPL